MGTNLNVDIRFEIWDSLPPIAWTALLARQICINQSVCGRVTIRQETRYVFIVSRRKPKDCSAKSHPIPSQCLSISSRLSILIILWVSGKGFQEFLDLACSLFNFLVSFNYGNLVLTQETSRVSSDRK